MTLKDENYYYPEKQDTSKLCQVGGNQNEIKHHWNKKNKVLMEHSNGVQHKDKNSKNFVHPHHKNKEMYITKNEMSETGISFYMGGF